MNITNAHLADFIRNLPGANPSQYAKLLSVSPTRINRFLADTTVGKNLVNDGKVVVNIHGMRPSWASETTPRGVLTGDKIPTSSQFNAVAAKLPPQYRSDVDFMFRTLVDMTSGNVRFEETVDLITGPYREIANHNMVLEAENRDRQAALQGSQETIKKLEENAERFMRLALPHLEAQEKLADQAPDATAKPVSKRGKKAVA